MDYPLENGLKLEISVPNSDAHITAICVCSGHRGNILFQGFNHDL